jgi:DNA polymerase-3 subunit alpha
MNAPKKFVGLHAHSVGSMMDGLGYPDEHQNFAFENGMDALALTDHGNMNMFPHAHQNSVAMNKAGKKFKFLPGVEAYYHPDLTEWRAHYEAHLEEMREKKKKSDEDDGSTIENEEETKDASKWFNPVKRRHHLVLLAKSSEGLKNIFKLVSLSNKRGFYKFPRIDRAMLKEYGKDVIVSSACIGGPFAYDTFYSLSDLDKSQLNWKVLDDPTKMEKVLRAIGNTHDQLVDAVGAENVFHEIQFNKLEEQHLVNRALLEFCKRNGLSPIATADSHYCRPELWRERELYKRLGRLNYEQIDPSMLPQDQSALKCELYPKNAEQMWRSYKDYCDGMSFYEDDVISKAIEDTWSIAHEMIGDVQPDTTMKLPRFLVPAGMDPFGYLVELCKAGMKKRKIQDKPEYIDRLKTELKMIREKDFSLYFITMKSIIDIADGVGLVGPGRGSGCGSLVNYILGITQLDPLKHNLLFSRFISASRKDPPDVDTDVSNRETLIEMMREQFGNENVYPIVNYNTLQLKSLVKDISRFYGIDFAEVNEATRFLDEEVRPKAMPDGENKSLFMLKFDDCMKYSDKFRTFIEKYPQIESPTRILYRQLRSIGKHAGGVIVTEDADRAMPIIAAQGELRTPWTEGMNRKDLEVYGLIKFDLLGLETLRIIERAVELVLKRRHGYVHVSWPNVKKWIEETLHPDVNAMDDQHVYENVFHNGNFAGIFQFTAKHTQRFIMNFKPRSIYDLSVATSIYRPGPLAADVDKKYIEAKNAAEAGFVKKYDHPAIEKVLGKTYGFCIFQEQLMQLAAELSGMNEDDCDKLRKNILKRSVSGQSGQKSAIQILEEKFITGAVANGLAEDKARRLFDDLAAFASYAFNSSHAVAYSVDSYMCAYLLTYYAPEWLCAYAETMLGDPESRIVAMNEIRSLGYKIGSVDINESTAEWSVSSHDEKLLIPSFKTVKGVGSAAIEEILEKRPYNSLFELLWNDDGTWKHSKFNKRVFENLIKVGAFESMKIVDSSDPCAFKSYASMHSIIIGNYDKLKKKNGKNMLVDLMVSQSDEDWSIPEKIEHMTELLGKFDTNQLIPSHIQERLEQRGILSIDDLQIGETRLCWFLTTEVRVKKTKTGKDFAVIDGLGYAGIVQRFFCWGLKPTETITVGSIYIAELTRDERGISTSAYKTRRLVLKCYGSAIRCQKEIKRITRMTVCCLIQRGDRYDLYRTREL